jgi:formylmethanofuran dehydrogenase subunit E
MSQRPGLLIALTLLALPGCAGSRPSPSTEDAALARVAAIHGGAGPWAVAGYRMGIHALQALGLSAGSFDVEVVHHSP